MLYAGDVKSPGLWIVLRVSREAPLVLCSF